MLPSFKLHMHHAILDRLAKVGKYDGTHPSLTCGTSSGKVFLHNPHDKNEDDAAQAVRFLNINRDVSALCVGKFRDQDAGDTLIVGTHANILGYNVEKNSDAFYKDVPDGVNTMLFGTLPNIPSRMVMVGGNCSIQGFDREGNETFWTVTGDNVTALALCDVSGRGNEELVVGSDDYEIRAFQAEDVVCECSETGRIVDLTSIQRHLFGYALDNGTVGVYKNSHRVWRVKSKNIPTSITAFDINGDGELEIVIGWNNGKVEARSIANGAAVYRDHFASPIAAVLTSDYRLRGNAEVLCCATDGEVRGYLFEGNAPDGTSKDGGGAATSLLADEISAEEKEVQALIKAKAGLVGQLKAYENASLKTTKGTNVRVATTTKIAITASTTISHENVELTVSTENESVIKMIVIFDYDAGIFDGESLVIRPATPAPKATVQLPTLKKNVAATLHFRVLVGNRGNGNVFHVFEETFALPKFADFFPLKAAPPVRPSGCVKFKRPIRMQQFTAWVKASFLQTDVLRVSETDVDLYFKNVGDNSLLSISTTATDMEIRVEDMSVAAEMIQDMCRALQIDDLESVAEFPEQLADFRELLVRVDDYNSIRLKLTGDMADDSNQLKHLVIRAEDARILHDMYANIYTCPHFKIPSIHHI
ncbi:hypothetical protein, variant [Aphanomyces astaci]|uniref:Bardet-Biedl syndrome 2 protein homolog n=1 Tax=Aphanomyces astaci TaxID=112090 RepID=W4GLA9_APHAT|nr:hypothetical protein, variant [Aphanomyces astaci]ETV79688.1 hypothetical protein, variant [Aphanomyces astaci]|eukprot:XP_009830624.1 hypothetical protein, variant [Aphanomyces astaci]